MFFMRRIRSWWIARNRDIFVYWDGVNRRRGDPIKIGSRLEQFLPNYLELLRAAVKDLTKVPVGPMRDDAAKMKTTAILSLVEAARKVFDLLPLSDFTGVTDGEAMGILTQYFVFMERLAEEAKLFTASPQPTA